MKLTRANVSQLKLPPEKSEIILFDADLPGFGIRLRSGGKRTWIVQYRVGAKQRRVTLGTVNVPTGTGTLGPDEARKAAGERLAQVTLGGDPQKAKHQTRRDAQLTFYSLIARYLAHKRGNLRPRTYEGVERYLKHHWMPLHGLPVTEIRRRDVAAGLGNIAAKNGPVAAARARVWLSNFFAWAVGEGLVEASPVIGTNKPAEPEARDRVLSDDEIADVWSACRDDDYGRIVKLALLTAARRDEVGGMAWPELNLERTTWSIPGERTKNGRPHMLPLSPLVLGIIKGVQQRAGRDRLFGEGEGTFSGWSRAKKALDERIATTRKGRKAAPIARWRLHDLRRTCATVMADKLGVLPHVIEAVLNHVSGHKAGVAGVYNRALYEREMRTALTLWADYVRAIVDGSAHKVVSLHAR
jgi:integrase